QSSSQHEPTHSEQQQTNSTKQQPKHAREERITVGTPNVEISIPDDSEFYERQYEILKRALLATESGFDATPKAKGRNYSCPG
uniref:hypothetical protein n=1 Tax=Corynebacterium diphtheriae TaxID=1717 RepID=UPI001C70E4AC